MVSSPSLTDKTYASLAGKAKIWRESGPEQKELRLFENNLLDETQNPNKIRQSNPLFMEYSARVFGVHFRKTKANYGGFFGGPSNTGIIELDGMEGPRGPPEKVLKISVGETVPEKISEFIRAPILPSIYTDPDTKQEKCLVVLLLYNGVETIQFDLVDSKDGPGPILKVTYGWPLPMYDVNSMFKRDSDGAMIVSKMHPKVLAVEKSLQLIRENMEDAPTGIIEVKLPVEVQVDPSTWSKTFNKKKDGSIIVFFEFICIRSGYTIGKAEKTLKFN